MRRSWELVPWKISSSRVDSRPAAFELQFIRDRDRDGYVCCAGVEHELDRLAVNGAGSDVVTGAVALQLHGRCVGFTGRVQVTVRVALMIKPVIEEQRQQGKQQEPGCNDHDLADERRLVCCVTHACVS